MDNFTEGDPEEIYEEIGALGEGSYGSVLKVKHKETEKEFAMKVIDIEEDMTREELIKEIDILMLCTDDFVVDYFEHYQKDETIYIVMELCEAGSVNDLMLICELDFQEAVIQDVIASALLGLEYLHSNNIIHRDVKAGNLLLTHEGQVKLGDFGVSARLTEDGQKRKTVIGTPFWMAPEVIQENMYDGRADIWSLGITLIELADTEPPYANIHPMRAIFMIPNRPPPKFKKPGQWSDDMNDFLKTCLQKDPEQRPTASELMDHPFVKDAIKKLNGATPRGGSDLLKPLVADNIEEIEQYRRDEVNRASSTASSTMSRGNTAVFQPAKRERNQDQTTRLPEEIDLAPGDTFIFNPDMISNTLVPSGNVDESNEDDFAKYFEDNDEAAIPLQSKEMVELKNKMKLLEMQFQEDIKELRKAYNRRRDMLVKAAK